MKLASCASALNPLVVYSTDRSKAVVPVLVLLFFSPFSIAITSLGEERANLCFSYVCSICSCLVTLISFSSWCLGRDAVFYTVFYVTSSSYKI